MATPQHATTALMRIAARARRRPVRTLGIALAVSLLVHAAWTLWPVELAGPPATPVLTATLTEMPAPPTLAAPPRSRAGPPPAHAGLAAPAMPPPARARPQHRHTTSPLVTRRTETAPSVETEPAVDAAPAAAPGAPDAKAVETEPAVGATPPAAPGSPVAENVAPAPVIGPPAPPTPPARVLPPRLDLAYKVFLGTQGFLIGDATYRFEHEGGAYRIATVAQARGLAALIIHGRGRIESRGRITATGLQPLAFELERGRPDRREVATFDWTNNVVTLNDQKIAPLDAPTFDPLTVLWQSYFTPPDDRRYSFNVATTRRVFHYTVTREGDERIAWRQGEVDTERWHRVSEDSKIEAWFWLAPSLHYIPIKIRVTQTSRGTLEALLDAIRTDAVPGGDAGDDMPAPPSTIEQVDPFAEHGQ